ncbi:hypothetical protein, partial [Planktothrix sp.]|uniref:hypothetical protein n=1 Tax=Planktothrix sp. TaxID=3088171 RepID=UPI0038D40515
HDFAYASNNYNYVRQASVLKHIMILLTNPSSFKQRMKILIPMQHMSTASAPTPSFVPPDRVPSQ